MQELLAKVSVYRSIANHCDDRVMYPMPKIKSLFIKSVKCVVCIIVIALPSFYGNAPTSSRTYAPEMMLTNGPLDLVPKPAAEVFCCKIGTGRTNKSCSLCWQKLLN